MSLISKDVSWLWRTAYNCAIQGCSEWEHCEKQISDLFDLAKDVRFSYRGQLKTDPQELFSCWKPCVCHHRSTLTQSCICILSTPLLPRYLDVVIYYHAISMSNVVYSCFFFSKFFLSVKRWRQAVRWTYVNQVLFLNLTPVS